ncbi:hypothetical protein GGR56DRAFT_669196 [Xylariaceae sp. FL0804]|nr:hypothetical protein GGR56DRAFT_669196 [Xylariaceae sp. FL0804]
MSPTRDSSQAPQDRKATRNSLLLQGETSPSNFNQDQIDDNGTEKKGDSGKKAQRLARAKGALDWTSKIYSLVSSGYLLQYAARGNHDRLPERILQLTKDSAAFASDLIPGRHWVLQVASATDTDGNILSDPKSKKSKLSLKGGEKKQVSSMLLVFESAEMMDEWLAILRHEIESLGGKKKLSETGKPDQESAPPAAFESPPSDRSSVIRDHKRPLSIVTREFSDLHDSPLLGDVQDDFTTLVRERKSEAPASEGSPTASLVSSDDQQLENLRTSENNNRHSYMSSGQKTVFTSSGSSPACSPTRESFSSHGEDLHSFSAASEARLRPNAAAISDRRQSMRYLVSGVELPADTDQRAHASASATASPEDGRQYAAASQQSVPNFSIFQICSVAVFAKLHVVVLELQRL